MDTRLNLLPGWPEIGNHPSSKWCSGYTSLTTIGQVAYLELDKSPKIEQRDAYV